MKTSYLTPENNAEGQKNLISVVRLVRGNSTFRVNTYRMKYTHRMKFEWTFGSGRRQKYGRIIWKYICKTLKDELLPEIRLATGRIIFQQDNAAIHKTAGMKTFLAEKKIETFEWPLQSP
jgi:hypothetical protein